MKVNLPKPRTLESVMAEILYDAIRLEPDGRPTLEDMARINALLRPFGLEAERTNLLMSNELVLRRLPILAARASTEAIRRVCHFFDLEGE